MHRSNGNLDVSSCHSWEATLLDVHRDLRARGVPHRWMLIDSYWYGDLLHQPFLLILSPLRSADLFNRYLLYS